MCVAQNKVHRSTRDHTQGQQAARLRRHTAILKQRTLCRSDAPIAADCSSVRVAHKCDHKVA